MDGESLEEHNAMMMTPLSAMAEAFEELDKMLRSREDDQQLRLDTFCEACSLVSVLFGCLGFAFKFAEVDYVSKVRDLKEASRTSNTLQDILDLDVANDTVKIQGSLSRNLRRVRQGLDLVRALFEQFLTTDQDCYLKEAASRAYRQVCAPYHSWTVRTAVVAGMCVLPTRNQLLLKLNETEQSAGKKMRRYIDASLPVIEYIDKLYLSRNISLDW
ncbi:ACD11 homolog protein isoform X1 [Juglans regia]|uniref:ACD11 homolog protein isoform X1 n=2 Tax=Juglans regia TaxID=51240 RepID=A0A2I4F0Z2_JUGRE|nr:ACD11 homolog protein isoform X1 [Juglans regia]